VLVAGDLMLDEYLFGSVNRISPEAPVPVVDVKRRQYVPGGAANVAANIRSLGATAELAGICGEDDAGDLLNRHLSEAGIQTTCVLRLPGRLTTSKTRIVAGQQQIVRVDREERHALDEATERRFEAGLHSIIGSAHALILSDYGKGLLTEKVCRQAIAEANRQGLPSIVDPKGRSYLKYRGCTLITPNLKEAGEVTGIAIDTDDDLRRAGEELLAMLPGSSILITRGPDGMALFREAREPFAIPTVAQEVFDVVGAGDTAIATLGVALGTGLEAAEAVQLANVAAGIAVGKHGTVAVKIEELLDRAGAANLL
jgi:D-beta-D-heptose 7-phosphate kinase/D-beta-D-heptose 1-phosphate adenosyltransferase